MLRYRLSFEDVAAGVHEANARRGVLTDLVLAGGAVLGVAGWLIGFEASLAALLAAACVLTLAFERLPPARPLYPLLSRGPGIRPYLADDAVVTLNGSGVHRTIGSMNLDLPWAAVGAVREDERYIHILERRGSAARWRLTIPKRVLTDMQLAAIREVIAAHPIG